MQLKTKLISVSAVALIDAEGRIFLAQRPANKNMEGLWEFPGGKIEAEETPESALIREIKEELGVMIAPADISPITFVSYPYETFHLLMMLYACKKWGGEIRLKEHQAGEWVLPADLQNYPMPPADIPLIPAIRLYCENAFKGR